MVKVGGVAVVAAAVVGIGSLFLWNRGKDQAFVQNAFIRVQQSPAFLGILDLFFRNPEGRWQQYNNVVPIVNVAGAWSHAEVDQAAIQMSIISQTPSQQVVRYQYARFSNDAHIYLVLTLNEGTRDVQFQVRANEDSAPIDALSLGNYYGYVDLVRFLKIDNITYDALTFPKPVPDGNFRIGRFTRHPWPVGNRVEFWGEGGVVQYQVFDAPLSGQDEMVSEIRFTPWLPEQSPPGQNWFETVHVTRSPFNASKDVWHFGYQ